MAHARLNAIIGERLDELPFDDERGNIDNGGRMRVYLAHDISAFATLFEDEDDLEDDELDFLCDQAGLIVTQLPDGTIYVRYFEDEDKLEDQWADLCGNLEDEGGASDDDESEEDEDDEE